VVLVTGYPSLDTAVASIELPVAAYLLKPVGLSDLLQAIKRAVELRRRRVSLCARIKHISASACSWLTQLEQGEVIAKGSLGNLQSELKLLVSELENHSLKLAPLAGFGCETSDTAAWRGQPAVLIDCIQEAIDVLRRTKRAFKSKQLGDLRKRLEESMEAWSKSGPGRGDC
jgi:YesN/AraC family two-component response regulator